MSQTNTWFEKIDKTKLFFSFLIFVIVTAYGYACFHPTVNIDILAGNLYLGDGKGCLHEGRFGAALVFYLFGIRDSFDPIRTQVLYILNVFLLLIGAFLFADIICKKMKTKKPYSRELFVLIFVSFPLISEIWFYPTGLLIGIGYITVALTLLCVESAKQKKMYYAYALLLTVLIVSGYESFTVVLVFAVMFLAWCDCLEKPINLRTIVGKYYHYVLLLVSALVIKKIITQIIHMVVPNHNIGGGATSIAWLENNTLAVIRELLFRWVHDYLLRAILYIPVAEYTIAMVVFVVLVLYKSRTCLARVIGLLAVVSCESLAIIQGISTPYRARQVAAVMIAVVAVLLYEEINKNTLILVLLNLMVVINALYLGHTMATNVWRSQEEMQVCCNIGKDIKNTVTDDKPVIFVGDYHFSKIVEENISIPKESWRWQAYARIYSIFKHESYEMVRDTLSRKIGYTDVNSVINWAKNSFNYQEMMGEMLAYYGYDYNYATSDDYDKVKGDYNDKPCYPESGYIYSEKDCYVVNLGPLN